MKRMKHVDKSGVMSSFKKLLLCSRNRTWKNHISKAKEIVRQRSHDPKQVNPTTPLGV
jgi:hypothetical protein